MRSIRPKLAIYVLAAVTSAALVTSSLAWAQETTPPERWMVRLVGGDAQEDGLFKAAVARRCEEVNRTDDWITFDCPPGQPPTPQAIQLHQYFLHDGTTNALIRANDVHAGVPQGAFDGSGVKVAVIDGGIDTDHPAVGILAGCFDPRGSDPNDCEDEDGHGTAVSVIIAGTTPDSVAPGASIIAVKLFNGSSVFSDDVAIALQALLDLPAVDQPDVINMSFGGGKSTGDDCDNAGDPAVELINGAVAQAGIAVVVSSGNSKFKDGVSFPGCASQAISVGAVYQSSHGRVTWLGGCTDRTTFSDLVTCFSNAGPGLDVVAPGAFISTALVGGGFFDFHGTSAAAPVVAGAAALLKQQNPALTGADIRDIFNATALEIGSNKNRKRNGNGRIDSVLAAEYADANFQGCTSDADCLDGDLCNGDETCDGGSGTCIPGTPLAPCVDDGYVCNGTPSCDPGTGNCVGGAPLDCDDGLFCTDDSCDPGSGCQFDDLACPVCETVSRGRCNCDGSCGGRERRHVREGGTCADCP